jgi:hypothetical protein
MVGHLSMSKAKALPGAMLKSSSSPLLAISDCTQFIPHHASFYRTILVWARDHSSDYDDIQSEIPSKSGDNEV